MTASSFEEERENMLAAGCDALLRKPFRPAEVFDLLHKHLGVRFVYEEGEGQRGKGKGQKAEEVLTLEVLAALPKGWTAEFLEAVQALNVDTAIRLVDQIHQQNAPLADALAELVKGFRFDTLQELFEQLEH